MESIENNSYFSEWDNSSESDSFGINFSFMYISVAAYYIVLIVFGLVGNLLIIIPFIRTAALRRVTSNFFVVHMACTNLFCICFFYPLMVYLLLSDTVSLSPSDCILLNTIIDVFFEAPVFHGMFCVALNQCLLIASPQKLHKNLCSKVSIAISLIFFWTFSFTLTGLQISFAQEKYCAIGSYTKEWVWVFREVYFAIYLYAPSILIPVCHITIFGFVRSSRNRTKNQPTNGGHRLSDGSKPRTTNGIAPSEISTPNFGTTVGVNEIKPKRAMDVPSCSYTPETGDVSREITSSTRSAENTPHGLRVELDVRHHRINTTPNASVTTPQADVVVTVSPEKRPTFFQRATRHFAPSRPSVEIDRSISKPEIRLIKMMVVMYFIVVTPWIAMIVIGVQGVKTPALYVLSIMGSLVPLCHAVMPYIYLWGNRNYHDAIKSLFHCLKRRRNRVRPT